MDFKITGIVTEKEGGKPVKGVLVVAYDKDPLFDDLLGTAETDTEGRFIINYGKTNHNKFLDKNPDLYLAVFAPPCRMLTDTSKDIRWGAAHHEFFNLTVDQEKLKAPEKGEDELGLDREFADGFEWEIC